MDNRVIGIFDSGLGGLTAVKELKRILPNEHFVFFGDTARNPYGSRTKEELIGFGRQNIAFLRTFDPKAIIVACGTISANALDILRPENDVPVFGVIEPAVGSVLKESHSRSVGVIATEASIKSRAYEMRLKAADPMLGVIVSACPAFVPLIESGRLHMGDEGVAESINEYLSCMKGKIDTLILGCTHYPLLTNSISDFLGKDVRLVDVAAETVRSLKLYLEQNGLTAENSGINDRYFVSGDTGSFARMASGFLGSDISDSLGQIDITAY